MWFLFRSRERLFRNDCVVHVILLWNFVSDLHSGIGVPKNSCVRDVMRTGRWYDIEAQAVWPHRFVIYDLIFHVSVLIPHSYLITFTIQFIALIKRKVTKYFTHILLKHLSHWDEMYFFTMCVKSNLNIKIQSAMSVVRRCWGVLKNNFWYVLYKQIYFNIMIRVDMLEM